MTDWTIFIGGVHQTGIQTCRVLNTIAGAKKCEFVLSDVTNMNDINHFTDIEIWHPTDDPGGGLIFDGIDDHIRLQNPIELDADGCAVSWWMKRDTNNHENIFSYILSGGESGRIDIDSTNNYITFESYTDGHVESDIDTGINTADGAWHHYVLDFNFTNTILYVDGSQAGTGLANSESRSFEIQFIGHQQSQPTYGDWFAGVLADIRIFDESISSDDVTDLYNGLYKKQCKAFYQMNQSTDADYGIYDREEISSGTSYTESTTKGALALDTAPIDQFIVFKGRVDSILPDYDKDVLTITGRDYLSELMGRACVEDYTTQLRSYIVNDILLKYNTSVSRRNITDSPAGTEISFLFKSSAWDAVINCALEDGDNGYRFWVDTDKDFHYEVKGFNDSGITIETGKDDILSFNIIENGADVINSVVVYGYDDGVDQVVIQAEDLDSQDYYGVIKEKKIINAELKTETAAQDFAYAYLEDHAYVAEIIEILLLGSETLVPGDLITLILPNVNINDSYLLIDKELNYPDGITKVRVTKYAKNLESVLNDLTNKILNLESTFMDAGSDILKLHRINEAVLYTDCVKLEKRAVDDSFKIGVSGWSTIGTTKIGGRSGEWTVEYNGCEGIFFNYVIDSIGGSVTDSSGNKITVII